MPNNRADCRSARCKGVLQPLFRGICSQKAAKWRKDQINDNPEIARLVSLIDRKLQCNADSVDLLYAPFPLGGFKKVRAKVRGSRYFATVYVRTDADENPTQALQRLLAKDFIHIELETR